MERPPHRVPLVLLLLSLSFGDQTWARSNVSAYVCTDGCKALVVHYTLYHQHQPQQQQQQLHTIDYIMGLYDSCMASCIHRETETTRRHSNTTVVQHRTTPKYPYQRSTPVYTQHRTTARHSHQQTTPTYYHRTSPRYPYYRTTPNKYEHRTTHRYPYYQRTTPIYNYISPRHNHRTRYPYRRTTLGYPHHRTTPRYNIHRTTHRPPITFIPGPGRITTPGYWQRTLRPGHYRTTPRPYWTFRPTRATPPSNPWRPWRATPSRYTPWKPPTPAVKRGLPAVCGIKPAIKRIVGGSPAGECKFPWMVSITSALFCGGTIIDEWHVLTAAHCFKDRSGKLASMDRVKVRAGSSDLTKGQIYTVKAWRIHSNHTLTANDFDIAVLTLSQPLSYGPCVAPICVAQVGEDPRATDGCVSAGWGLQEFQAKRISRDLREVPLPIVPDNLCLKVYGHKYFNTLKMCAGNYYEGGVDTCKGDSGGPLMCKRDGVWIQHGIVSFGRGCAIKHLPGVYTRLSNREVRDFVVKAVKEI